MINKIDIIEIVEPSLSREIIARVAIRARPTLKVLFAEWSSMRSFLIEVSEGSVESVKSSS